MDTEIANLEAKLAQLVEQFQQTQTDNRELRVRIAALEKDNKILSNKVRVAVERVESVLAKLPMSVEE
ncbi:MAG TPA: hypothetical protein VFW00_07455 [Rhodocyclaceae bacterium]|nr:hypothetical protein [Rhodocyclaceae bacterium]